MITPKIESYVDRWARVGEAGPENAKGLMFELARLAWDTNTDPATVSSLRSANVTWDELQAEFS